MKACRVALVVIALMPAIALAHNAKAAKAPASKLTGKGQFGFLASQGTARARSANAELDMAYVSGPWKHAFHAALLYGESAGVVSAERWDVLWQSAYRFSTKFYTFGAARYERDLFNGFQYQGSAAAGIGYQAIESKSTSLSIQLGAGYMLSRPEQLVRPKVGVLGSYFRLLLPRQNYAIVSTGLDYSQKLTQTTTLSDKLLVNAGSVNTLITNALALVVRVSTRLALSLGYNLQDNTHPPGGIKSINTTETVNLVYSF